MHESLVVPLLQVLDTLATTVANEEENDELMDIGQFLPGTPGSSNQPFCKPNSRMSNSYEPTTCVSVGAHTSSPHPSLRAFQVLVYRSAFESSH